MSADLKPLIAAAVDRPLTEDEARAAFTAFMAKKSG